MIAIDLGSNTLRVLAYECLSGTRIFEFEKVVRTADGLVQTGIISQEATAKVIATIKEAQEKFDFSSSRVKAVTTEAMRRASNSVQVLDEIKKETGVAFEIITGEEEARLTLKAVKYRLAALAYACDSFVVVDIGGGSTELIFHYGEETFSQSFPVGIVTIAQTHGTLEAIRGALPAAMQEMSLFCQKVYQAKGKVHAYIATAGTPTTVAAMKLGQSYEHYDASKINGTSLHLHELDIYLEKLLSLNPAERQIAVGTGRADLVAAGILIYKQLYRLLGFETCIVIDDGLREGVALDACK